LREGFDLAEVDILHPCRLLALDFREGFLEVGGNDYVAQDIEATFFEGVAESDEFPGAPGIVYEEQDLGAPELDVLLPETEEVLAYLVIYQAEEDH
jgi:hypothetical protein